ncbi:MAG TPA: RNA polymerase sigma factor [Baekduia sp.]|uniref:RNA polymerase sigma factor n=1 Tax=Baekduia sp. TaxID=2600305 RepID=UPI002CC11CB8|nr:RNA polymerase sigma factor [Baekduia sp.]HMJ32339.1 RNA polymerase sigma factor [Baekduia sp.]
MATLAAPGISATARSRTDVTDHDLVQAVRAGDDHAFERLYHRYHRRIAGYIFGMVHDYGRAEDLTQEVFVSALRRMRQTERLIAFKPWIYEIAKNASIDAFRRSKRAEEVSYDADEGLGAADHVKLAATGPSPDAAVDAKQQLDHLCGAFGGLSDAHHQILVLRELEGLSYREIGDRLGMSRPSVESTLFRARRRLTEEYEELVTGEQCLRIQAIIAGATGAALGLRDTRRVGSHISYCRPCRRQAVAAGLDAAALARRPVRAKIAAFLPLPAFLRRRWLPDGSADAATAHVAHHGSSLAQMSMAAAQYGEPAMSGWMKAGAVAAAVAVAGVGTGAVQHGSGSATPDGRDAVQRSVAATPAGGGAAGAGAGATTASRGAPGAASTTSSARRLRASSGTVTVRRTPGRGGTSRLEFSAGAPAASGDPSAGPATAPGSGAAAGGGSATSGTPAGAPSASRPTFAAGGVTQTVTDAVAGAGAAAGAATGGAATGGPASSSEPLVQPDLTQLTQAPANTPPPTTAGGVVQNATGAVGQTVGGQVGGAVKDTGAVLGGTVDQVAAGVGGVVGGLLGGT